MTTQKLKTAAGYHYKDLVVISHGAIVNRVMVDYSPIWTYGAKGNTVKAYLITTRSGFTVKTTVHSTALRDALSTWHLLQISTKTGEIFFSIVAPKRISEIRNKALFFIKAY